MATTERTTNEAQKYIEESFAHWIASGEEKKVRSLAAMAEKWRSRKTKPRQYMMDLQKNINALETLIRRKLKLKPNSDNSGLQKELEETKNIFNKMVETHGELPTKKPKKQE